MRTVILVVCFILAGCASKQSQGPKEPDLDQELRREAEAKAAGIDPAANKSAKDGAAASAEATPGGRLTRFDLQRGQSRNGAGFRVLEREAHRPGRLDRSVIVGEDGRLWVRLFAEAEKEEDSGGSTAQGGDGPPPRTWREPAVYDVFEPDGVYLGQVRLPPGASLSVRRGDHVWGVRRDDVGTPSVVRFRIVAGG